MSEVKRSLPTLQYITEPYGMQGRYWKCNDEKGIVRVTVLRDLGFVSSKVVDKSYDIQMTICSHLPFYLHIYDASGLNRTLLVKENRSLEFTLNNGEQVEGTFLIKG